MLIYIVQTANIHCSICVVMNSKDVRSGGRNITLDWAEFIIWRVSMRDSGSNKLSQAAENSSVSFNSVSILS